MNGRDSKGVNWEEEKRKRTETRDFEDEYEELHFRTERISRPPKEGDLFHEGRQEANIQSDGETGRLLTHSHKELFRCDCGCIVENIRQTVRDASGKVFCEKHGSLFCRLCSQLIMPGEQVRIGESYYHRSECAERVVNHILREAEIEPEKVNPIAYGEMKALQAALRSEKRNNSVRRIGDVLADIFSGRKPYAIKKID
jgi:hypothetical protein